MPNREYHSSDDEYVTRRELYLTIQPLVDKQTELTEVMTDLGKDLKRLLLAAERHDGVKDERDRRTDKRRFWLTILASLCAGLIVVLAAAIIHAL